MDYKKAYNILFNAITDAINEIEKSKQVFSEIDKGIFILKEAQCKTEEIYLETAFESD